MQTSYQIVGQARSASGQGIKCLSCGLTSYNPNDVANRYCGNCQKFHETFLEQLAETRLDDLPIPADSIEKEIDKYA